MPHLSIDHSPELSDESDMQALCQKLRDALVQTGVFPLSGTRVRTHPAEACAIADGHRNNRYCAMTLSVGAGRSRETLLKLILNNSDQHRILRCRWKFEWPTKICHGKTIHCTSGL